MRRYIGDRAFYRRVFAVPIVIQNGITNFVGLLDNLMVGQIGTTQMNGIAIANQLIFVFNLFIFGAISGAGIFGAQFYGRGDYGNVRNVLRLKIYICAAICALSITVFLLFGRQLLALYLSEGGESAGNPVQTLGAGQTYLMLMLIGLLFGAGKTEEAINSNRKLTFFAVAVCVLFGGLLAGASPFIPLLYNTEPNVRALATDFILISAATMPIHVDFFVTFIIHLVLRFCQENSRTNPRKMRIHPAESEEGEKRSGQTASKASFRSSRISSMCSVPIERRIVFGLMP